MTLTDRLLLYYLLLRDTSKRSVKQVSRHIHHAGEVLRNHSDLLGVSQDQHNTVAYGGIYADNNATTTDLANQDTWYQITIFHHNDETYKTTPDHTSDDITIQENGVYRVHYDCALTSAQSNAYYFAVYLNNGATELNNTETETITAVASQPYSISGSGLVSLTAGDTVELWVQRTDGGAVSKSITLTHASLNLYRLGN